MTETGERIPLTIMASDPERGRLSLSSRRSERVRSSFGNMEEGDSILDVVGPLGMPTHIENFGTAVCIGGGIGIAPVVPIAKALKEAGNKVLSIIGARNKQLLILEDRMREVSDELFITTDDGSYGHHGFVTQILQKFIDDGCSGGLRAGRRPGADDEGRK